jgi:hypothetical protein
MLSKREKRLAALGATAALTLVMLDIPGVPGAWIPVCIPFAAIAAAFGAWRYREALFGTSRQSVVVASRSRSYHPGDDLCLAWSVPEGTDRVDELRFSLSRRHYRGLDEKDVTRRTLDGEFLTRTSIGPFEVTDPRAAGRGQLTIPLPAEASPSLRRKSFWSAWVLLVESQGKGGRVVRQEFAIPVRRAPRPGAAVVSRRRRRSLRNRGKKRGRWT